MKNARLEQHKRDCKEGCIAVDEQSNNSYFDIWGAPLPCELRRLRRNSVFDFRQERLQSSHQFIQR